MNLVLPELMPQYIRKLQQARESLQGLFMMQRGRERGKSRECKQRTSSENWFTNTVVRIFQPEGQCEGLCSASVPHWSQVLINCRKPQKQDTSLSHSMGSAAPTMVFSEADGSFTC